MIGFANLVAQIFYSTSHFIGEILVLIGFLLTFGNDPGNSNLTLNTASHLIF